MTTRHQPPADGSHRLSRRHLLLGGAAAGVGAVAAVGIDLAIQAQDTPDKPHTTSGTNADPGAQPVSVFGAQTEAFFGVHQAGITTEPQTNASYLAFDLLPGTDRSGIQRMMRILSDDADRLTRGRAALADTEPELAEVAARLTITFGFGPELVRRANHAAVPEWLRPLPPYSKDALDDAVSHGDLLVHVASDDPLTASHAIRMLTKDTRAFASHRWTQTGFRRARGSEKSGTTMRNLFGQVDGTVNPVPGTADFDGVVWVSDGPKWMLGGTSLVLRRIAMNLDTWDRVDRVGRDQAVGRRMSDGSPLTGKYEHDEPDFEAKNTLGFPVISEVSHIRRARTDNPKERIYRRGYNYDDSPEAGTDSNAGLLFLSYQANPMTQFAPIQQRLDELDLLNEWISHVGSGVYAIPPGCSEGGYIGEGLFA